MFRNLKIRHQNLNYCSHYFASRLSNCLPCRLCLTTQPPIKPSADADGKSYLKPQVWLKKTWSTPVPVNLTDGAMFSCNPHHPVSLLNSFCPDLKYSGHPEDKMPATVLFQVFFFFLTRKKFVTLKPSNLQ